jgi:hypothetical protein
MMMEALTLRVYKESLVKFLIFLDGLRHPRDSEFTQECLLLMQDTDLVCFLNMQVCSAYISHFAFHAKAAHEVGLCDEHWQPYLKNGSLRSLPRSISFWSACKAHQLKSGGLLN